MIRSRCWGLTRASTYYWGWQGAACTSRTYYYWAIITSSRETVLVRRVCESFLSGFVGSFYFSRTEQTVSNEFFLRNSVRNTFEKLEHFYVREFCKRPVFLRSVLLETHEMFGEIHKCASDWYFCPIPICSSYAYYNTCTLCFGLSNGIKFNKEIYVDGWEFYGKCSPFVDASFWITCKKY